MRIGISASTVEVLASITVIVSSFALETKTCPAAARIPEGLLPPWTDGTERQTRPDEALHFGRRRSRNIHDTHRVGFAQVRVAQARDFDRSPFRGTLRPGGGVGAREAEGGKRQSPLRRPASYRHREWPDTRTCRGWSRRVCAGPRKASSRRADGPLLPTPSPGASGCRSRRHGNWPGPPRKACRVRYRVPDRPCSCRRNPSDSDRWCAAVPPVPSCSSRRGRFCRNCLPTPTRNAR